MELSFPNYVIIILYDFDPYRPTSFSRSYTGSDILWYL